MTTHFNMDDGLDTPIETRALLHDTRIVTKPGKLGDDKSQWMEWKFDFENFLSLIDPVYVDELRQASAERELVNDSLTTPTRRRSVQLYAILCSLTQGKAKMMLMRLSANRNGFEGWRQLVQEYEPASDSRRLTNKPYYHI